MMITIRVPFLNRRAMALFPFVLFRDDNCRQDPVLVNHERIHLAQQLETLVLPFYLIYTIHYLYSLIGSRNHESAYRNIIFEQEAYRNQGDPDYLSKRKPFSFLHYL